MKLVGGLRGFRRPEKGVRKGDSVDKANDEGLKATPSPSRSIGPNTKFKIILSRFRTKEMGGTTRQEGQGEERGYEHHEQQWSLRKDKRSKENTPSSSIL